MKKCMNCGKVIDYEEWVRLVLHPNKHLWDKRKYCNTLCQQRYRTERKKDGKRR